MSASQISIKSCVGRLMYANRAIPQRVLASVVREPVLVDLGEFKLYVRLDDWLIGARIILNRSYEKYVADVVRPRLKPGDVMLDLGANIGYFTMLGAACVGAGGKVIAFEPSAANCALVRASAARNGFSNVTLHQKAVAERAGWVGLELEDSNGKIVRDAAASEARVETVALDKMLADEPHIHLVKMDIEGAEPLALAGMTRLLERHRPLLFTEFHPVSLRDVSGFEPEDYLRALRALGYDLHVIDRVRGLHPQPQSNGEIWSAYAASPYEHIELAAFPRL